MRCIMRCLVLLLLLSSCASGLHEARRADARRGPRTVVLFLVDGLGAHTLQKAFLQKRMPNTRRFFLRNQNGFALAQAAFPTLTYPNLVSVLTAKPVGEHPVLGNHAMLPNGKIVNYEDAKETHQALRALVDPQTVIARLSAQNRESASFSYIFGMNAESHMQAGLKAGLEYQRNDYLSLDDRLLTSMSDFLKQDSAEWPDFIYVHLIGVDAVAHTFGATSKETLEYLSWLDSRLAPVFTALAKGEGRRKVVTMLTADHSLVDNERYVSLRKKMIKADLDLVVANESRFLALHLPRKREAAELDEALRIARASDGVAFTAWRRGNELEIESTREKFRFLLGPAACGFPVSLSLDGVKFECATTFDEGQGRYPFLVSQLTRYFTAPHSPNALVIAKPGVSFAKGSRASHGGPTAEETLVPLLVRNGSVAAGRPVLTSELLKLLDQPLPSMENMNAKPTPRQANAQ